MTGELLRSVLSHRILPVVVMDDPSAAEVLAHALLAGGLPVAEVTLRTPTALQSLRVMAGNDDLMVGAGTVVAADQAEAAVAAGARFLVSPGLSLEVLRVGQRRGIPVIPGAVTPTEVMAALAAGVTTCKFFPAASFGGVAAIRALAGPFGQVQFVPTGGIGLAEVVDYLALDCVPAVGGSWMVPADAIAAHDVGRLTDLAAAAVSAVTDEAPG